MSDYAAERYNRRTRALERQADAAYDQARALERIADALSLSAIAAVADCVPINTTTNSRVWTLTYASKLQNHMSRLVSKVSQGDGSS